MYCVVCVQSRNWDMEPYVGKSTIARVKQTNKTFVAEWLDNILDIFNRE